MLKLFRILQTLPHLRDNEIHSSDAWVVVLCEYYYYCQFNMIEDYQASIEDYLNKLKKYEEPKARFSYIRIKMLAQRQPFATMRSSDMLLSYVNWEAQKLKWHEQAHIAKLTLKKIEYQYGDNDIQYERYHEQNPPHHDQGQLVSQEVSLNDGNRSINNPRSIQNRLSHQAQRSNLGQEPPSPLEQDKNQSFSNKSNQSSLKSCYTKSYPIRKNKQGYSKVYKCICGFMYHQRLRVGRHMLKCAKRRTLLRKEDIVKNCKLSTDGADNMLAQSFVLPNENREAIAPKWQSNTIYEIINKILSDKLCNYDLESYKKSAGARKMAEQVYFLCEAGIKNSIVVSLTTAIEKSIHANQKKDNLSVNFISKNLLSQISSLDFDSITINFSDQLAKAHSNIQLRIDKQSKTFKNNELAYTILQRFTQFDLKYHVTILNEMAGMSVFPRRNVSRYWRLVKRINGYFQNFPDLPLFRDTVAHNIKLTPVSIQDAAKKVKQIFQSENKQLAADMWVIITSGLRSHDVLKLNLFDPSGKGIKFCRLIQRKNSHIAHRYIPESVIEICLASKSAFPMTQTRLSSGITRCLRQFKAAYGFKHRALTTIITSLYQSSAFGKFHHNPQTTIKHYLDKNDARLLDKAFSLNARFIFTEQDQQKVSNRNIYLDLTGKVPIFDQVQQKIDQLVTFDCTNIIQDRIITSCIDGNRPSLPYLSEQSSEHFGEAYFISKHYDSEMIENSHQSIEQLIGSLNEDLEFLDSIEQSVYSGKYADINNKKEEIFCQRLSINSQNSVHYYQFDDKNIEPVHSTIFQPSNSTQSSPIVITKVCHKNNRQFKSNVSFVAFQKSNLTERKSKLKARQKLKGPLLLELRHPKCANCSKEKIISLLMSTSQGIKCSKCLWVQSDKNIEMKNFSREERQIISTGDMFDIPLKCIDLRASKNNLRKHILNMSPIPEFAESVGQKIETNYVHFSKRMSRQIKKLQQNLQFLSLQIRASNIENAGMGVFSTCLIPKDTLVLTYTGEIALNYATNLESNSLFTLGMNNANLGWLKSSDCVFELFCDGNVVNNGSRFINCSPSKRQSNLFPVLGVHESKTLIITLVSNRQINKGQELFYWYGELYWGKNQADNQNGRNPDDFIEE